MLRIFLWEIGMLCWDFPIDTEGIIKDTDASICLWVIEVITLVLEDCCFWENGEAMAKSEGIPTEHAILSEKDTKHDVLKDFDSPFDINIDLYKWIQNSK